MLSHWYFNDTPLFNYSVLFSSIGLQLSQAPQQFPQHLPYIILPKWNTNGDFGIIVKPIQVTTNDNEHGQRQSRLLFVHLIRFFSDVFGNDTLHISSVVRYVISSPDIRFIFDCKGQIEYANTASCSFHTGKPSCARRRATEKPPLVRVQLYQDLSWVYMWQWDSHSVIASSCKAPFQGSLYYSSSLQSDCCRELLS